MIRQEIKKLSGKDGGWVVKTFYAGHLRRETWTLETARGIKKVAKDERIELCRTLEDES